MAVTLYSLPNKKTIIKQIIFVTLRLLKFENGKRFAEVNLLKNILDEGYSLLNKQMWFFVV